MERKNAFAPLLTLSILILTLAGPAQAQYGGGTGEPDDPYRIYTPEQMNAIGADPNHWDKHFKLMADIDLAQYTGTEFNIIGVARARSRGDTSTEPGPFTGGFNGHGYTIFNFTWRSNDEANVGLFRCVADPNATIENLNMVDPNVAGQSSVGALVGYLDSGSITDCSVQGGIVSATDNVGGLVGRSERGSTVANCYAEANIVLGDRNVGGLLGYSNATVTDCRAISDVAGGDYGAGGLVGWYGNLFFGDNLATSGTMTRCDSGGIVAGGSDVGGLAGTNLGRVTDCRASGSVTGDAWVGGLVGSSSGIITECHASGDVLGTQCAGGLVGYGDWESRMERCYATGDVVGNYDVGGLQGASGYYSSIADCYAMGNVSGRRRVGGLVGHCSSVVNCYSAGIVRGDKDVGGLVGKKQDQEDIVEGCFWDIDTSGQPESAGGSAKATSDMYRAATFLGWGDDVWTIDNGNDYPRLWWEEEPGQVIQTVDYPSGTGTPEDPILIYTAEEMAIIGWFPSNWDKHFKLMADIDLVAFAGASFCIIGDDVDKAFTGVFDGNGYTIANFTYRSLDQTHVGIFGYVCGRNAEITNLGILDPAIEAGNTSCVGPIAGSLDQATVRNCYVEGGIALGSDYDMPRAKRGCVVVDSVGGLVGRNSWGYVMNCYATTAVFASGWHAGGGLVGQNWYGTITHCYSIGPVQEGDSPYGPDRIGGLVRYNGNGEIELSFWDTQSSGLEESDGGTGLTTTEMQDISTYLDAGWDFIGESSNGMADTWYMPDEGGYPKLTNFSRREPFLPHGKGTIEEPYLISNAYELAAIGYRNTACYRLDANIDFSDITWTTAVVPSFHGHFDGNGHVIRNLQIEGTSLLGLFGCVGRNAVIVNLGLPNSSVEGTARYVGSLVGLNSGHIANCYSTGAVKGSFAVGGLAGGLHHGSVLNCYSTDSVTGHKYQTGGLVGYNYAGSVGNCYSTGLGTGGLVATNQDGSIFASFWDMETSQKPDSEGGTGLTTSEMMSAATFLEAGWDFMGETENGVEDIWWIDEGRDYPRLWWEDAEAEF